MTTAAPSPGRPLSFQALPALFLLDARVRRQFLGAAVAGTNPAHGNGNDQHQTYHTQHGIHGTHQLGEAGLTQPQTDYREDGAQHLETPGFRGGEARTECEEHAYRGAVDHADQRQRHQHSQPRMDCLGQQQGRNLHTYQSIKVGEQADVQHDDQETQPQATTDTAERRRLGLLGQTTDHRQHGEAHGNVEGRIQQSAQRPVRHFSAEEGDDRNVLGYRRQLGLRTRTGIDGIDGDRQHHDQQERHYGTDQVDDALDVQAQSTDDQHRHQDGAHHGRQTELLGQGRARTRQHHHTHAIQEEGEDDIHYKTVFLAEQDIQHLLVRTGLHDRADPRDLHAQEGKQHRCHYRSRYTGEAVPGKELQHLVTGGKTTANDHGHVGQRDLQGVFIHSSISTVIL